MDTALTNEPFQHVVLVWIEQAQKMHAVLGHGFEAAECKQVRGSGSLHQPPGFVSPVVVRDPDNLDSYLVASINDGRVVFILVLERRRLVVPPQVGEWVDLQGAAVEPCTAGQLPERYSVAPILSLLPLTCLHQRSYSEPALFRPRLCAFSEPLLPRVFGPHRQFLRNLDSLFNRGFRVGNESEMNMTQSHRKG